MDEAGDQEWHPVEKMLEEPARCGVTALRSSNTQSVAKKGMRR